MAKKRKKILVHYHKPPLKVLLKWLAWRHDHGQPSVYWWPPKKGKP